MRQSRWLLLWGLALASCAAPPAAPPTASPPSATVVLAALTPTAPPPRATAPTPVADSPTVPPLPTPTLPTLPNDFGLTVPPGVRVELYAENLANPVTLALGEPGVLYVSLNNGLYPQRPVGEIRRYVDEDGDGLPEHFTRFAEGLDRPLGLLFHEGALLVSLRGSVQALRDTDGDGVADAVQALISELPALGLHQNNSLALGPDGKLYLGMGSSTNAGPEPDERNGTILRFEPDGSQLEAFARGLRNPFDLAFDGQGQLFATDNGCDPPACVDAPEELNHIVEGGDYGFPELVGPPPAGAQSLGPVALFPTHASANGIVIYAGAMFPEWQGDALVAFFGSYLAGFTEQGQRVVRVELRPDGDSFQGIVHPFIEGLDRPLDLVAAPDGSLLLTDFGAGRIYRVRAIHPAPSGVE